MLDWPECMHGSWRARKVRSIWLEVNVEDDAGERAAWVATGILNTFSTNRRPVLSGHYQQGRRLWSCDRQAQAANIASIDTRDANCTDEVTFPTGELGGCPAAIGEPGDSLGQW